MRSGMTALVVAAGMVGILAVASFVGPPGSVVEVHEEVQRPVVRTSVVCPLVGGEEQGSSHLGVFALPNVPTVDDEEKGTPISARPLRAAPEAGSTPDPSPTGTAPPEPLFTVEARGSLNITDVENDEAEAVAVEGAGSMAPGLVAEQSLLMREVDLHGVSTASCGPAAREHWFVGGSGAVGKRGRLVLANPTSVAAVVDIELWDDAGPIEAPATKGVGVPARSQLVLLLDALAPESENVGVKVATTQGRVSAALEVRETDEITPQGISYIPAASAPSERVVIPGVPGHGRRSLRILVPGETDAIVSMRMLGPNGPFAPVENEVVTAPAGSVHEVPLQDIGDPVAVELNSDQPISAAVRVMESPDDGLPDVAFTAGTPPMDTAAAALLGRVSGDFASTLHLSSVGETSDRVTVMMLDEDGAVAQEESVNVPQGATVPVELEPAGDSSFATVVVQPGQPGTVVAAREIRAADDDGAYVDLMPLWSPTVEVDVPEVVGELPGVLDRSEE